jgi:DNA polymerase-3 subunit epsilon
MIYLDIESDNPRSNAEPDPVEDRIISLAIIVEGSEKERRFNPGFPLTRTGLHGITDQDLAAEPSFSRVAKSLLATLETEACICTYNGSRYDVPLLYQEFSRAGMEWQVDRHLFIDLAILWRKMEPRKLADAAKRFARRDLVDAHTALADAAVLPDVLAGMAAEYPDLAAPTEVLAEMSQPTITIGGEELPLADLGGLFASKSGRLIYTHKRVRGVEVTDDFGYAQWLLNKFPLGAHSRMVLEKELHTEERGSTELMTPSDNLPA